MEVLLRINTEKDKEQDLHNIITRLYNKTQTEGQQTISQNNKPPEDISIVVRDGESKTTAEVKETLKRLGFNYYAKLKSGKSDPRWTQTCSREHWNSIKDNESLKDLNIWTSDGGGSA